MPQLKKWQQKSEESGHFSTFSTCEATSGSPPKIQEIYWPTKMIRGLERWCMKRGRENWVSLGLEKAGVGVRGWGWCSYCLQLQLLNVSVDRQCSQTLLRAIPLKAKKQETQIIARKKSAIRIFLFGWLLACLVGFVLFFFFFLQ